ncbi:GAF domain-containing protein, partial [Deinococcus malanensis]
PTFHEEHLAYMVSTLHDIHASKDTEARLTVLRLITTRLSDAKHLSDVLAVLPDSARVLHAPRASLTLVRDGELHLVGTFGFPETTLDAFRVLPEDADVPVREVLRTGEPLVLPYEAFAARYPHLASLQHSPSQTLAFIPLRADGRTLGVLTLGFLEHHDITEAERTFLLTLASSLASTL